MSEDNPYAPPEIDLDPVDLLAGTKVVKART